MKKIVLALLLSICLLQAKAQDAEHRWGAGLHLGKSGYSGDLGSSFLKFNKQNSTYGATLATYISKTFDGLAHANYSTWGYEKSSSQKFDGHFYSYGFRVIAKANNGQYIKENAVIRPYLAVGVGLMFAHSNYINKTSAFGYELGYGFKVKMLSDLFLQIQSIYGFNKNDETDNINGGRGDRYALHTLGLVYHFAMNPKKDSDGDGVPDFRDKCPNTAIAVKVNGTGCPADSDGDGVPDYFDRCPTIIGSIDLKGCPDTDGDGIGDNADKCPSQKGTVALNGCPDTDGDGIADVNDKCPEQKGEFDNNGCPFTDSDLDGITDNLDKCPNEKGVVELRGCPADTDGDGVNDNTDKCPLLKGIAANNGCPEIKMEDQKKLDVLIKNINFKTGSDEILTSSNKSLNMAVEVLKQNPNYKLNIGGHTDNVGDAKKNLLLSEKRANAVKNYFISKGIDKSRIQSKGYGDTKPLVQNTSTTNKAKNRRVELKLAY